MDRYSPLGCFIQEWICYLELHQHRVKATKWPDVLVSRNCKGRRYRWLVKCTDEEIIHLTAAHQREVRSQVRVARQAGEQCYLVVKFGHPGGSAIAVPAATAAKAGWLSSSRGAIPWDC